MKKTFCDLCKEEAKDHCTISESSNKSDRTWELCNGEICFTCRDKLAIFLKEDLSGESKISRVFLDIKTENNTLRDKLSKLHKDYDDILRNYTKLQQAVKEIKKVK
jgi:hypothetical protein